MLCVIQERKTYMNMMHHSVYLLTAANTSKQMNEHENCPFFILFLLILLESSSRTLDYGLRNPLPVSFKLNLFNTNLYLFFVFYHSPGVCPPLI